MATIRALHNYDILWTRDGLDIKSDAEATEYCKQEMLKDGNIEWCYYWRDENDHHPIAIHRDVVFHGHEYYERKHNI